jgi:hypothetical protein
MTGELARHQRIERRPRDGLTHANTADNHGPEERCVNLGQRDRRKTRHEKAPKEKATDSEAIPEATANRTSGQPGNPGCRHDQPRNREAHMPNAVQVHDKKWERETAPNRGHQRADEDETPTASILGAYGT